MTALKIGEIISTYCSGQKKFHLSPFLHTGVNRYICFLTNQFHMQRFSGFAVLSLILIFPLALNAQFEKGTRMVGASVASLFFNSGNSDQSVASIGTVNAKVSGYGINITPSVGWFLSENTAAGVTLSLNPSAEKQSFEENGSTFQKDNTNSFSVGVGGFLRSYFKSSGSLLPFGQLGIDAGMSNTNKDGFFYGGSGSSVYKDTYETKSSGGFFTNASFVAGVTKMVGEYTGLDIYLGYNLSFNKRTVNTTTQKDIGIDGSIDETLTNEFTSKFTNHKFMLGVGFQIFLKKKKK